MKYLLSLGLLITLNTYAATITTSSDEFLVPAFGCRGEEVNKKTILLIDETVKNKEALISALASFEARINQTLQSDDKTYLLNHTFLYSTVDDQGEHSANWQVQTPKSFGNRFSHLHESLSHLHIKIGQSMQEIKNNSKAYQDTMLLEQVVNYSRNLEKCDQVILISDLMLVDKNGTNNFEKNVFTPPLYLGGTQGKVILYRVPVANVTLAEISAVTSWWEQSLNGGQAFTNLKKSGKIQAIAQNRQLNSRPSETVVLKEKSISAPSSYTTIHSPKAVEEPTKFSTPPDTQVFIDKPTNEKTTYKSEAPMTIDSLPYTLPSNPRHIQRRAPITDGRTMVNYRPQPIYSNVEADDEEYDFEDDYDFSMPMKPTPRVVVAQKPLLPVKPVIDQKLLKLSCDEFSGRLTREGFPICKIDLQEVKNSKVELTINADGRIVSFENSANIALNKKICLSGYVASKPATSVGTDLTCRTIIQ